MNDRRPTIGIVLIMLIVFIPIFFRRSTPPGVTPGAAPPLAGVADSTAPAPVGTAPDTLAPAAVAPALDSAARAGATAAPTPERTIVVRSGLYRFAIASRGGRVTSAKILGYRSLSDVEKDDTLELLPDGGALFDGRLAIGNDTVRFDQVNFTSTTDSLTVTTAPETLTLSGDAGPHHVELTYIFTPDDYRVRVDGRVTGLGPTGGTLLVGLGDGFRDTESNVAENHRETAIVTKQEKSHLLRFSELKEPITTVSGPFEWVAVKSKYFVVGFFNFDSTAATGAMGKINGVQARLQTPAPGAAPRAHVAASITVPTSGEFGWSLFVGPMEYDRLMHMGRDFDDVNPYGWAWLRWLVRPFAIAIRWVFVGMHESLGLGYGWVIVAFGVLVRILLWPLNKKAMKSMVAMQAVQPQLQAVQARFKDDPQRMQQETFKLYRDNKVNPLGGCWPMLIPYPLLVAVFFVLAYTIEVRGVSFLWMSDLSRHDPTYIIPILMAVSMFGVSKVGQIGMPPNPQTKMMMYVMPVMMLVMFANFASGLNLYYAVQNFVSLPQQWLVMKERQKLATAPVVGKKK